MLITKTSKPSQMIYKRPGPIPCFIWSDILLCLSRNNIEQVHYCRSCFCSKSFGHIFLKHQAPTHLKYYVIFPLTYPILLEAIWSC
ncbi:Uncharacterized protein TCM_023427 [Theobroma cacao]|uniref:Uncharacterized protein n=1 Tax=Theobroma cacao TaxID=3641 RepID=A0A061EW41_THECC|nr:Uncharacterized protein TCM_023427 [Theobroma cacao]